LGFGCSNSSPAGFALTSGQSPTAEQPFSFHVSAVDGKGQPASGYQGTVLVQTDDPEATLPGNFSFASSSQGASTLTVTFKHSGPHTITVKDVAQPLSGALQVTVLSGPLDHLTKVSGDNQGALAGSVLQDLVVRAEDHANNPVPGVPVTWKVASGGGSINAAAAASGADGLVKATATLGGLLGKNEFDATSGAQAAAFFAMGNVSGPAQLVAVSGDAQSGTVATPLGQPLVVKVTDTGGNPVPGVAINWAAASGGGSFPSTTTSTDMSGLASATPTLGTHAGANGFTATTAVLASGGTASFAATATAGAATTLVKTSGDGQVATAGTALAAPFVVTASDQYGNPVGGLTVSWAVTVGGGSVQAASASTAVDGTVAATGTLGPDAVSNTFTASAVGVTGSPPSFTAARRAFKLAYTNPTGGKLQLVKNAASTDSSVILDLVVAQGQTVTGYSAGFNLPVDVSRVQLDATAGMTPGSALNPGTNPVAALASLPLSGPLAGVLVSAQSQKAAGTGAVSSDTTLAAGTLLYSLKLNLVPTGFTGVAFDGTDPAFKLPSGGVRNRIGIQPINSTDIGIGKLEIIK
jgi:hypothetical protein